MEALELSNGQSFDLKHERLRLTAVIDFDTVNIQLSRPNLSATREATIPERYDHHTISQDGIPLPGVSVWKLTRKQGNSCNV